MVTPGIYYFQLAPKHFLPSSRSLHPHIRQTCNSIWRQHLALARTSPEFAHVVNLAHTQSKNKRYIDAHKKYPFNVHDDLVVFSLGPAHGHDWMSLHVEAPADLIYNRFGHGLKRVGIKYEEDKHICARAHEAGGEWGLDSHTNIVGECWGPCWASTFRYISFFRDAELVYLMVYLTENQIHYNLTAWRVASKLQRIQKGMSITMPFQSIPNTLMYCNTASTMHMLTYCDQKWASTSGKTAPIPG